MNMIKSVGLGFVVLMSVGLISSFAQTPNPPTPKNPLLHRAPVFASWTVQFSYKPDEKQTSPAKPLPPTTTDQVQSLTVTKTNQTYWEQTVFKSGKKEEKWILDGVQLLMLPGSNVIVPVSASNPDSRDPNYSDYSKSDFDGFSWVSLDTYKGIRTYEGKPAYLFELPRPQGNLTALLSVETQMPLYFSDAQTTRAYVYNPAPSAPLTPPANFLSVLGTYNKGIGSLTRRPRSSSP